MKGRSRHAAWETAFAKIRKPIGPWVAIVTRDLLTDARPLTFFDLRARGFEHRL